MADVDNLFIYLDSLLSEDQKNEFRSFEYFSLCNQLFELGLFISPYLRETEQPRDGATEAMAGAGDLGLRAKWNFWGNDTGRTAFGLIVDATLPGPETLTGATLLDVTLHDLDVYLGTSKIGRASCRERVSSVV